MLPDNWNDSMTSKMAGYSFKGKTLNKGNESYQVVGHVHTHQDKSFDQGPSKEDLTFMQPHENMFFFILHANNNIYGVRNINGKLKGWSNENYLEKVSNALTGQISLSYIIKFFSNK